MRRRSLSKTHGVSYNRAIRTGSRCDLSRLPRRSRGAQPWITRDDGDLGDSSRTLGRIVIALEKAGVEFLIADRPGVRLTKP